MSPPSRSDPPDPASSGWAPFPVQDWSAYQATESWREYASSPSYPGSNLALDPLTDGPGPRSSLVAILVLALTFVVLAGGLVLADGSLTGGTPTPSGWLPVDGAAAPVRLTGARSGTATIENGIAAWPEVAQSLTLELGETMLVHSGGTTGRLWRQTLSPTDPSQPQLASVYSLSDGIRLELDVTSAAGAGLDVEAFQPGLPVLPTGVVAGQRWRASGTWADVFDAAPRPYTAELSAAAAGDCLVVSAEVVTQRSAGPRTEDETWRFCPGAGVVERSRSAGVGFVPDAPAAAVNPGRTGVPTGTLPPTGAPVQAQVRAPASRGLDLVQGTPRGSVPPFAVTVDQIVWTNQSMQDLLVLGISQTSTGSAGLGLTLQRRLHPGGIVLTATSVQSTVLATTSTRRLTAWTPDGARRWSVDTGEVVVQRPVALDPTTVLTITVTGIVTAWDLASGSVRWRVESGSGVAVDPAVGAGVVVVADTAGGLVGYDVGTGSVRWSTTGDPAEQLAVLGGHAIVVAGGLVYAYGIDDGVAAWTNRSGGVTWELQSDGADGIWLTGPRTSALLELDTGVRRWHTTQTCDQTTVAPAWLVCWSGRQGRGVNRMTGVLSPGIDAPAGRGSQTPVLVQGRLWVFNSVEWSAWAWPVDR